MTRAADASASTAAAVGPADRTRTVADTLREIVRGDREVRLSVRSLVLSRLTAHALWRSSQITTHACNGARVMHPVLHHASVERLRCAPPLTRSPPRLTVPLVQAPAAAVDGDYWQRLAEGRLTARGPSPTTNGAAAATATATTSPSPSPSPSPAAFCRTQLSAALRDPGYATVAPAAAAAAVDGTDGQAEGAERWWERRGVPLGALARTMRALQAAGWPPVFIFMYADPPPPTA